MQEDKVRRLSARGRYRGRRGTYTVLRLRPPAEAFPEGGRPKTQPAPVPATNVPANRRTVATQATPITVAVRSVATQTAIPERRPEADEPRVPIRPGTCWNCGKVGHRRVVCTEATTLFCSWCGKRGVLSRDCCGEKAAQREGWCKEQQKP